MISPSSGSCPHPNCSVTSSTLSEAPTYPLVSIQLPFTPDPVLQPPVHPYTNDLQRPASSALTTPQLVTSAAGVLHSGVLLPPHFPSERSADGPGFLYAFIDHGVYWKVGMSVNYDRRKAEWDRQCLCPGRVWLPPMRVLRRRKSGSKAHIEIFFIPGHWFVVWETIVLPILARVVAACVILKGKLAKINDIRNTFPSGYLGYRGVLMSPRPDIETSQCPKVPISTTSRCPDVPTSRTPILGEITLKNRMLSTRRIFRENFKLSRQDYAAIIQNSPSIFTH
ncbi:hypothetical protein F5879DRAFT_927683 [Lentinula edodes]|nr:hypothetical protein F5879DRAFT_927683 [Lentinula edodes]